MMGAEGQPLPKKPLNQQLPKQPLSDTSLISCTAPDDVGLARDVVREPEVTIGMERDWKGSEYVLHDHCGLPSPSLARIHIFEQIDTDNGPARCWVRVP